MYEIRKVVRLKILYIQGFVTKEGEGIPLMFVIFATSYIFLAGTRWRSWLGHCATSRKVAGSIPDGVTEIFH